jgi:ribosomal-protein-alanine N-acetyltransferase
MNLADITLRLARRNDAPMLAAMSRDLIESGLGWQYRPERVSALLADPDTVTVVACERERTTGFAIMKLGDERAHIVLLAVARTHQRRGIGRRMTAWVVQTAAAAGVISIHVELRAGNHPAYALYRKLGFAETLRLERYYRGRETAIRMMRLLRLPGLTVPPWRPPASKRR